MYNSKDSIFFELPVSQFNFKIGTIWDNLGLYLILYDFFEDENNKVEIWLKMKNPHS